MGGEGGGYEGGTEMVIAEPVPERYRFTYATIPALLMKTEPWGDGRGERDEGEGESHTCRVLLEMKEAFELGDVETTAQPYRRAHEKVLMCKDMRTHTYFWY